MTSAHNILSTPTKRQRHHGNNDDAFGGFCVDQLSKLGVSQTKMFVAAAEARLLELQDEEAGQFQDLCRELWKKTSENNEQSKTIEDLTAELQRAMSELVSSGAENATSRALGDDFARVLTEKCALVSEIRELEIRELEISELAAAHEATTQQLMEVGELAAAHETAAQQLMEEVLVETIKSGKIMREQQRLLLDVAVLEHEIEEQELKEQAGGWADNRQLAMQLTELQDERRTCGLCFEEFAEKHADRVQLQCSSIIPCRLLCVQCCIRLLGGTIKDDNKKMNTESLCQKIMCPFKHQPDAVKFTIVGSTCPTQNNARQLARAFDLQQAAGLIRTQEHFTIEWRQQQQVQAQLDAEAEAEAAAAAAETAQELFGE